MKAARLYGANDIRLEEIPVPAINENEILLKVKAAALCGTDIRMIQNGYPGIDIDNPLVIGHELSGVIEKTGSTVTGYRAGQRVAVAPNMGCGLCDQCVSGNSHLCPEYTALGIHLNGGFAEYVALPATSVSGGNIVPIDDHVSFEEAAVNEALSCVCNGFERCDIRPGESVVVIGAGPIGVMHSMMAKMAGAGRVYINDLSADRLAACKKIDPSFITVEGDIVKQIMADTNGRGADVCISACPAPAAQSAALELCAMNGRVNFFGGIPAGKQPVPLNTNLIHYKQLTVSGTARASLTQFRRTLRFISTGVLNIKPLITRTFAITDFNEAVRLAAAGNGMKNVIVM